MRFSMEPISDNHASDERTGEFTTTSAFESREEVISFAQNYFADDFPNPERLNCPPPGALSAFVRSGKLPDDKLRAHLFGCSDCFQEYRNAIAEHRSTVSARRASWWNVPIALFRTKPIPVLASVFSLFLLSFAGVYIWQKYQAAPDRSVANQGAAPTGTSREDSSKDVFTSVTPARAPVSVTPTEQTSPLQTPGKRQIERAPRPRDQRSRELLAMNTVKVDLEEYAAVRGGEKVGSNGEKLIKLSQARTRLLLRLPEGSVKGLYNISIVDSSGKPLVTTRARSSDGQTITTTLNVEGITAKKYRLRISREGEAPDYYPVVVEAEKTVP